MRIDYKRVLRTRGRGSYEGYKIYSPSEAMTKLWLMAWFSGDMGPGRAMASKLLHGTAEALSPMHRFVETL